MRADRELAIVPGKPDESELLRSHRGRGRRRADAAGRTAAQQLTPQQIETIRRWIEQGAAVAASTGRSFRRSVRRCPRCDERCWARNPIDRFVLARLEPRRASQPSPEADRATLIRRVTLDLTGLPPTPEEIDAFLADESPDAYEKLVDRLLASPRYGEHMARYWLDAARYGDTHGLHLDNYRSMWPYRDWVIGAFNDNKPFDQFTDRAAGRRPAAGADARPAGRHGFNRCNVTTSEGGSIDEEFYVRYAVDRVDDHRARCGWG